MKSRESKTRERAKEMLEYMRRQHFGMMNKQELKEMERLHGSEV